jgi:hypothetical protein
LFPAQPPPFTCPKNDWLLPLIKLVATRNRLSRPRPSRWAVRARWSFRLFIPTHPLPSGHRAGLSLLLPTYPAYHTDRPACLDGMIVASLLHYNSHIICFLARLFKKKILSQYLPYNIKSKKSSLFQKYHHKQ